MPSEILLICCPKCGSRDHLRLEKLRQEDNICLRCRRCGHIFSPRNLNAPEKQAM